MIQSSTSSPLASRSGYPQLGEWLLKSPIMIHLSSSGWMAWRRSAFGGGEYRLYMDRGLPSSISFIPRTSVSLSPGLWISAAGVLHQNKESSFRPMFSVSSESLKAPDREAVVWTEMSLLNAADIYVVCFLERFEVQSGA